MSDFKSNFKDFNFEDLNAPKHFVNPSPPSRMLADIDDVIESLEHVVEPASECEEQIRAEMFRAFARGRALYKLLEQTQENRLQRARELVAFSRNPGKLIE
jgi:hypothetical protein